ncbi:MAG: TRAP transporter small permease subunit [Nitrospirota bacterium]
MKSYIKFIDALSEKTGMFVSWLTGLMVLVVCYDVLTRYVFRMSSVGVQELEWHLFSVIFLLGASYTLKLDRHVRIDIFYMKLSRRGKAVVDLAGTVLFLVPFALLVIWTSKDFTLNSFTIGESSPDPGGLPARYILKACVPLGFFLVLLQGIALAFRSILVLSGEDPQIREDGK